MDNSHIKEIFNLTYNGFWSKYKNMTGAELVAESDHLVDEAGAIMMKYDSPICKAIMTALLDELDARAVMSFKEEDNYGIQQITAPSA